MSEPGETADATPQDQQQDQPQQQHRPPRRQQQGGGNRDYQPQNSYQQKPRYNKKQNRPVYVEDLREKLNRKRQEKDESGTSSVPGPPPDPNYNFLKDPARDGETSSAAPERRPQQNNQYSQNRRPNEPRNRHYPNRPQKPLTIQPVNIKVELSTSTGQRSCVVDEDHKLPEIKHVPDRYDGRRPQNTRYYSNRSHQQQQQQQQQQRRKPPNQHRRRDFREGEQGGSKSLDTAAAEEENWDATAGGGNEAAAAAEENWDEEAKESGKQPASEAETNKDDEPAARAVVENVASCETKEAEAASISEKPAENLQDKVEEAKEVAAALKESIIIEPTKK